jgi:hypothetical protein
VLVRLVERMQESLHPLEESGLQQSSE